MASVADKRSPQASEHGLKEVALQVDADHSGDGASPAPNAAQPKPQKELVSLPQLFRYADRNDKLLMVLGALSAIAGGCVMPSFSLIFGELIDSMGPGIDSMDTVADEVQKYALIFLAVGVGAFVVSYVEMACFTIAAERQVRRIREEYVAAILRQEVGWFDKHGGAELSTRVTDDVLAIQEGIGDKVGAGLRCVATFFAGFILGFIKGWQLTLVILAVAPLLAISGAVFMKLLADMANASQAAYARAGAAAEEALTSIRTVLSFNGQDREARRYEERLLVAERDGVKKGFYSGAAMSTAMFLMLGSYGLAFFVGSRLIAGDREDVMDTFVGRGCPQLDLFSCSADLTTACTAACEELILPCALGDTCHSGGSVLTVFFAVLIGAMALGQASPSFSAMASAQGAAFKVFQLIGRQSKIDPSSEVGARPVEAPRGEVELRNVRFAYPARPEVEVLHGYSLRIRSGQTVALVGGSGSGKSTVVQLVQRFYDPQEGEVLLDGRDVRELSVAWLREQLGLVSQEPTLFAASVRENIRLGKPGASDGEVESAARLANAHDFIMRFPQGYDTQVGDGGSMLSGGQKQRVAIARAIIRNPSVLLLDEATSALDSESERVVQAALDELLARKARTTIVIAHRLSTIRNADRIVVMHQGEIVEDGSHAELLEREAGVYRHLVQLQSANGGEADGEVFAEGALVEAIALARQRSGSSVAGGVSAVAAAAAAPSAAAPIDRMQSHSSVGKHAESAERGTSGEHAGPGKGDAPSEGAVPQYNVPLSRILAIGRPELLQFVVSLISTSVAGLIMPAFALLFTEMLVVFFDPDTSAMKRDAGFWALGFLTLAAITFVSNLGQMAGFTYVGEKMTGRLRVLAFRAMLRQDVEWFDEPENAPGALTARLASDAAMVKNLACERIGLATQNVITLVAGIVIAFYYDWRLTLVVLATIPMFALGGLLQMRMMMGSTTQARQALEQSGSVVTEAVVGIRTVTAFGMQDHVRGLYRQRMEASARLAVRRGHMAGLGFAVSQLVIFAAYGVTFWVGGLFMREGYTNFESMMKVMMAIFMSAMGVGQTAGMMPDVVKARVAASAIFSLLDRVPAIDSGSAEGARLGMVQGEVRVENVHFHYKTRPDAPVFQGMDLTVKPGEMVGLVGASGSGKSTIVSLLERFYDPRQGQVTVDGVPTTALNVAWLRERLALVSQEPILFNRTVKENIKYGREDATDEEVEAAARLANAHDFIMEQPEGYDTVVGPRGNRLSGGQKQRVAIARAIIRNPSVLLLDEATSALDSESERVVQAALDELLAKRARTTIVIAHRLSTIQGADRIVVMHEGRVVEEGKHGELLGIPGGYYAALWTKQEQQVGQAGQAQ